MTFYRRQLKVRRFRQFLSGFPLVLPNIFRQQDRDFVKRHKDLFGLIQQVELALILQCKG